MLQRVAVCSSVLQCVAIRCSVRRYVASGGDLTRPHTQIMSHAAVLQYVAVCCSVFQRVAVCCRVLQRVAPEGGLARGHVLSHENDHKWLCVAPTLSVRHDPCV